MVSLRGKTVLVTGGALGVGREFVRLAAGEGAKTIVIWDVRSVEMAEVANAHRARDTAVHTAVVDLSDRKAIEAAAERVLAEVGPPHVLVNNAGVVNSAPFWEQDPDRIDFVVRVNTLAPMHVARAFLPAMLGLPEAHLLNMVSAGAYLALPGAIVYTASKWGAMGWSEGLVQELKQNGIRHLHVTSVFPGLITSGMFEGATLPGLLPGRTPEQVARAAWEGMKAGRSNVHVPRRLAALPMLRGVVPNAAFYGMLRTIGVLNAMAGFKGGRGD
ncbi:MAG TPA: SDR family NAD(P)-dependent oxidoreductase [Myxococcota bacterium]|nr:SDR family NAD(P)-dependent oxidoreductase [Myxococcota bacterium]